jgi:hypothetical protein
LNIINTFTDENLHGDENIMIATPKKERLYPSYFGISDMTSSNKTKEPVTDGKHNYIFKSNKLLDMGPYLVSERRPFSNNFGFSVHEMIAFIELLSKLHLTNLHMYFIN